jgi:hypothetical protein
MHARLTVILPTIALAVFAGQSYVSWRQQARILRGNESVCFWWSNHLPLDSKPLEKTEPFPGNGEMTQCGFELEAFDRFGSAAVTIYVFTSLPAFLAAVTIAHWLGKYGVSEIRSFMIAAPMLIASWFYGVALLFEYWQTRRFAKRRRLSPSAN